LPSENPSFTGEENPVTQWENFQIQVIDFLESGIPRHDGQGDRYLGLTEVADYFQTGVEIHIMTPQFEIINTPIGVVEYKRPAELQYNDMIMLLLAKTRLILDGRARTTPVSPFIWAYQPEDDREGSVGSMRLDTTRRGRALYQFDPLGRVRNRGNAIYRRARLIMEGDDLFNRHRQVEFGQVYFDEWQDEDADLRILTTPDDLSCGGQIYSEDEVSGTIPHTPSMINKSNLSSTHVMENAYVPCLVVFLHFFVAWNVILHRSILAMELCYAQFLTEFVRCNVDLHVTSHLSIGKHIQFLCVQ